MADATAHPRPGRTLGELARYAAGILIGLLVLFLLFGKRGELAASWHQLGHADPRWLAAALGAEALSQLAFAYLQHRVLRLTGTTIRMPALLVLTLANDAIACTVPGEPAVSSAYRFRYYRRHGATGAGAGWTVFTMLVAQAIGMSLLLLVGVVVALTASTNAVSAGVAVLGLAVVVAAGAVLIRRDLVLRLASALVRGFGRVTRRPAGSITARVESTLTRMREIPLSAPALVGVVGIATAVWFFDFGCLVCSFVAVHGTIPWDGVLLAYGVAQVVGSIPIVPGGLGIVEGSLAVVLIAYGAARVSALAAAITFRIVNYWLAIVVGWASVGLLAFQARRQADQGERNAA